MLFVVVRSVVVPSHGNAVPRYMDGARVQGFFLDLCEKIFFLVINPGAVVPPWIEFLSLSTPTKTICLYPLLQKPVRDASLLV
jgi:hypothetical protein